MKKSIKNKIIACVLVLILMLANFQGIITEGINVYASSIENQNSETNHKNVDFNTQFMVLNNEKKYSVRENISNSEICLNIFTEVKEAGYLKSGRINIKDENGLSTNFNLIEIEEPNLIQKIDYAKNEIILNQINNGEKLDINIPIKLSTEESFNLNNFSKDTVVTFNGTYVDGKGEEKEVEKEIKLKIEWKEDIEAILTSETIKVLPFETEENKGVIISEKISLGIKDSKLPIKSATLDINVPKIEDTLPTEVRVESENLSLNKEYKDGKLTITLENKANELNIVKWDKSLEQLEITYVFENLKNYEIKELQSIAKLEIECYSGELKPADSEITNKIDTSVKLGDNIAEATKSVSGNIYKGNMLNTTNETEFEIESNIDIAYEKLVEKVEVKYNKDKFVLDEKDLDADTYYKKLIISKENFNKLLGESGEIKIYSADTLIDTINNTTVVDEDGNIVITFADNSISELKLETTKPVYSGKLKIRFLKAIKTNTVLTKEEIKNISNLKLETVIDEVSNQTKLEMKNGTTKIGLETNTNILSTVVENKGVEFRVSLKNNDLSCDLFKDPKIELRMPEEVTDLKINNIELLLEDELVIKTYEYIKETNSIVITLEGTQTKYNLNDIEYGATVIVNTDITLNKLAINKKDKVKLFVINEASTAYESVLEEKGYSESYINIVAPLGLIALNSAEGYNETAEETVAIGGNEAVGKIEANAKERKITTMKITAINNYDSKINNIRILGRIPFVGNKSLVDGTDLGTTFDSILKGKVLSDEVPLENTIIYYSENGDATEDLNNTENSWVIEPTDLSKIKSYLIVLKDYEMEIGQKIEFRYDIEVPAELELGNSAHGTYIIYYDNIKENVTFENTTVPTVVELTTGEAPKLEVLLQSSVSENEIARSGQLIKYTVKVKNIGSVTANQVFVIVDIPQELTYAELVAGGNYDEDYYEFNKEKRAFNKLLDDIEPGQEQSVEFMLKVNENIDKQKEINMKAKLSAKNLLELVESNEVKNIVDNGSMLIELKANIKENSELKAGDSIKYTAKINNISNYDINNVKAIIELPEGLNYKNAYIKDYDKEVVFDENTRTITYKISKIEKEKYAEIVLEADLSGEKEFVEVYVKTLGDNVEEHKSNSFNLNICKSNITVKQESTIPEGYVAAGDKVEYRIEVKNTGTLDATNVEIIDLMPKGMKYIETSYEINGKNKTINSSNNNEAKLTLNIPVNTTVNMNVKVKVQELGKETKATNIVKVINDGVETEANQLTHTIEARALGNSNSNGDTIPSIELKDTYKISGTAWHDKNGDGIKDDIEDVLAGITVILIDKATGQIAKDVNKQELTTTTEGKGTYTFRNLMPGEYMVVFIYDNSKYVVTEYKKAEVEESKNSDVVDMKININGQEKTVAVSDTLLIKDDNIYNINIGLKEMPKFDLKLDKYVSKITVKNSKEAITYNYENTKMAKVEVNAKTANETTLIIEYKLVITNEGSLEGYAKKIVDYMPKELKFSSELNNTWYLAEDGNIYNSELSNIKIKPGESKEISLILTKQITGENTGLINNNAEIVESYNDYGTNDIDSEAGNKKIDEDDISNADIYIGIKTGSPVTYIGLSIVIMMVLGAGAYLINTKVLIKE